MALKAQYLADKSALARAREPAVSERLRELVATGRLLTCSMVDIEILFSARNGGEHEAIRRDRALGYRRIDMLQADFDRAIAIQGLLADRGHHRAAAIPDLLIAAVAERAGCTVLHYDRDYELIAAVAGLRQEWVVPAGSVP